MLTPEEEPQPTGIPRVPVVPGDFHPPLSNTFIGPLPDPLDSIPDPEYWERRKMWYAAGVIALASSAYLVWAFAQRTPEPIAVAHPICKIVAVSETAPSTVSVNLDQPAGGEKVWVGNYRGVMEAQPVPGSATEYTVHTGTYLHDGVIGAYVGGVICEGRFNLGGFQPGDEERFFS